MALLIPAFVSVAQSGSTLATVQARGKLNCGVNQALPGFGFLQSDGSFSGFDVDYCRALAGAVLGDGSAVEFFPLTAAQRFDVLASGEIDVLSRNTTWTISRDTDLGNNFAPTTFYDGQGFMVRKDSGITDLKGLDGASICVATGTTTEANLADTFAQLGLSFEPVVFEKADDVVNAYDSGRCDAFTTDKSGLASRLGTLKDPSNNVVLAQTISKEPLGPLTRHGDDQWFDIVKWTVFALFFAEENGLTQGNVVGFSSTNPEINRFLGVGSKTVADKLGLSVDAFVNAIAAVGNYGEIYDRNLVPLGLERAGSLNASYLDGGLIYAPPFR